MTGHTERLSILLVVKATFGQGHDVVTNSGWSVASMGQTEHTERLLLEELRSELLKPAPGGSGDGLDVVPGGSGSTVLGAASCRNEVAAAFGQARPKRR